jgi:hypothetical protein
VRSPDPGFPPHRTASDIENWDLVSSGIIPDEVTDKNPREWTKQALITSEEATEVYMVEVVAKLHYYKQQ